ncbi:putative addiction module antidote protein [Lysobacter pythonis]|uniref:Putative addiction module antidote protein n=2 Tax=Solilutibacter pythonis TaxID=2483112 RepID=A0A3M2HZT0_9GAMM|nr:putative addiction module antidote protein [Lysobacter pythonis]
MAGAFETDDSGFITRAKDLTQSGQAIADFMAGVFETNDSGFITRALGVVTRAKGMTRIAHETGLSQEQLCSSFNEDGNPTLRTMRVVMKALGIELTAKTAATH